MHCKDTILRTQNNWPYSKLIPNSGIILCAGKNDCTLVALTGKIRQKDIDKIIDQQIKEDSSHER